MTTENNQIAVQQPNKFALAREMDSNTWNAIKEIYDGASDEKIGLVIDYCKARKLDPLKKPVHIVPVWSNRRKMMVETLWPSISEARITAIRTGLFAGQSATEFGKDITRKVGSVEMTFPEYAMLTVFRLVNGQPQPFPGPKCRWTETYANRGKDDPSPNAMWAKRPYGQIEKCAEAAALRRAFPEEVSYTAEEMHGKELDENEGLQAAETITAPITDRPPPKERAKRGVAGAKEVVAEVVNETADEVAKAMKEREEKLGQTSYQKAVDAGLLVPPTPDNKREREMAADPDPAPAPVSRAFLQDGEKVTLTAKVESFTAHSGGNTTSPVPFIKAMLSGGFGGEVRDRINAEFKDGKPVAKAPWAVGATLSFALSGAKSTAKEFVADGKTRNPLYNKVLVWIDSIATVETQEME